MQPVFDLRRRLAAEGLGTCLLAAVVVGSGIMADRLSDDAAVALLCNALATGAALVVLITIFGSISGAHLNPAVSLVLALRGDLNRRDLLPYGTAQIAGGLLGTAAAHAMFDLPLLETSTTVRTGVSLWLSEVIATFGLVTVILAGLRFERSSVPWLVGLYITSAYWFTASTSFANPAIAIARAVTNTFSGIRPIDVPAFVAAELAGAVAASILIAWLLRGTVHGGHCHSDRSALG